MNVSRSSTARPWKCGRVVGLMFFILASPLISLKGKRFLYMFSSIPCVHGFGSYSPIGSSKIFGDA